MHIFGDFLDYVRQEKKTIEIDKVTHKLKYKYIYGKMGSHPSHRCKRSHNPFPVQPTNIILTNQFHNISYNSQIKIILRYDTSHNW